MINLFNNKYLPLVALGCLLFTSCTPMNSGLEDLTLPKVSSSRYNQKIEYDDYRSKSDIEKEAEYRLGYASFYGPGFHGKKTANGEIYDQYAMTAAHKTLPFGSMVEVTDVDTTRKVHVRINDRGPFIPGRIIDLSVTAARQLGIYKKGVSFVRIRVIGKK